MTKKNVWMIPGISLCFLYIVYVLYLAGVRQAVAKIEAAGARGMVIGGFLSVTQGEVIRADETSTIIKYYNVWDGAEYQKVLHHANAAYSQNAKVAVVYSVGMAMGSCLVAGFYRKYMLICGVIGLILCISAIILKLKRKGK